MDSATTEEKFRHAVQLIQNLPKSGNFQPSNDLKLKFYSYFKQATVGPCDSSKPGFWDVVSRAKWDAWSRLGKMTKEAAMKCYVDEFIEILKTQPFDEKAHDFVDLIGPFIDFAPKEFKDKYKGLNGNGIDSDSLLHTTGELLENNCKASKPIKNDVSSNTISEGKLINGHLNNGVTSTSEDSDCEEFSDTFDQANEELSDNDCIIHSDLHEEKEANIIQARGGGEKRVGKKTNDTHSPILGSSGNRGNHGNKRTGTGVPLHHHYPTGTPAGSGGGGKKDDSIEPISDVNEQLAFALSLIRLQHTMEQVVNRLDSLEALLQERKSTHFLSLGKENSFWSIFGIPFRTAILILSWPFLAHWIIYVIQRRRRK